jgi:pimeloyl-ACP methyl ester carboxylesterase
MITMGVLWIRLCSNCDKIADALKFHHYFDSLRVVTRRHDIALQHFEPRSGKASNRHCLILHGWASDASALMRIREYLRVAPQAADWNFWDITYDTTWQPFPQSAVQILGKLKSTGHDFSETLVIGYSMGGLVARQLVAEGLPCSNLMTLCTPHHGPVRWMPIPTRGPRSLGNWSRHTKTLNHHPRDIENRKRYHFFGITYTDTFGFHNHDGMVSKASAMGEKLGEVATRRVMQLKYSVPISMLMPVDPHWRGMFPKYIGPALRHAAELMKPEHD